MGLSYDLEAHRPKQIGLIVLQSDESLEPDFRKLMPSDVEYVVSRVPSSTTVSSDTLRAMEQRLTSAASLLPRGAQFSAVGYGCTSAAAEIGADKIAELIGLGVPTPFVTDPVSALIAACEHLGVSRIGIVSPYVKAVSDRLIIVLETADISVVDFASFEEPIEERVVRISQSSVKHAAVQLGQGAACDAVFLSCTNLRTLDVIEEIEAEISKPVLSSNQVLAWHLAKLGNCQAPNRGIGRLNER